jgi:hypothetical protein
MRMVKCPACGAMNSARRESCYECGASLGGGVAEPGSPPSPSNASPRDALIARVREELGDADWQRLRQAQRRARNEAAAPIVAIMVIVIAAMFVVAGYWWPMTMGALLDFLSRGFVGEGLSPGPAAPWTWQRVAVHLAPTLVLIAMVVLAAVRFRRLSRAAVEWVELGEGSAKPGSAHDLKAIAAALNAAAEADREAPRGHRLTWFQELAILLPLTFFALATLIFLPENWSPAVAIPLKALGGVALLSVAWVVRFGWPGWLSR